MGTRSRSGAGQRNPITDRHTIRWIVELYLNQQKRHWMVQMHHTTRVWLFLIVWIFSQRSHTRRDAPVNGRFGRRASTVFRVEPGKSSSNDARRPTAQATSDGGLISIVKGRLSKQCRKRGRSTGY